MPYLNFNSAKPFLKMIISFLSIIAIGLIVYLVGILFAKFIFSLHLDDVNHAIYGRYENLSNPQLKLIQVFQTLGFFVLPGLFLYWLFSTPSANYFSTTFNIKPRLYLLTILTIVISIPFINWIIHLNDLISFPEFMSNLEQSVNDSEALQDDLTKRLLSANNIPQLMFSILMIGILPAIGEEFIFRGVFHKIFTEAAKSIHFAVIITAFIFSFVHGQFHGFIARFLLGVFLGYLMVWGRTIWLPVIGHFLFNTLNIIIYYFMVRNGTEFNFGIDNYKISILMLPVSILLTIITIFLLYRFSEKNT